MITLDILISCCNDSVNQIAGNLPEQSAGVRFIVIHQQFKTSGAAEEIAKLQQRADVLYVSSTEKGLSRSRNLALAHATADVVLFSDDDITFMPDAFDNIRHAFLSLPQAAVITFRYCTAAGQYRKKYPQAICRRRMHTIFRVSSVEVAARRLALTQNNIKFDERFGLGTTNPVSEENIFLSDCLSNNLQVWFYPATLVIHPDITSGANWNTQTSQARGALFKRAFGWSGLPLLLLFMFKHSRKFGNISSFFTATKSALHGFRKFKVQEIEME